MPNAIAYLALILWPVVCMVLFRRLALERAIIWSILGGYLLLPQRAVFDLPLVPDFDKTSIPNLCALVLTIAVARQRVPLLPRTGAVRVLLALFLLGTIPTVLTNTDPIPFRALFGTEPISFITDQLPGLRWLDLFSVLSNQIITLIPFVLGWAFLASERGQRELLLALVVGALAYSLPALLEIRLSPQINIWVYGFFQHGFEQMMRQGGFRPIVFLPHALWLAFFMLTAVLSAAALARSADRESRPRYIFAMLYLAVVLYLCKSLASFVYMLALVPLVLLAPPRWQVRVAVGFAAVAVLYPILRDHGLVPLDRLLAWAAAIDPDRAQSLGYRFDNEEALLARAHEKWLFGWGGWGRNLVRDPTTGQIWTIPDGEWIITFGTFGWVGYLSKMGLLAMPLLLLWWRMDRSAPSRHVAALAVMLAITLVDMLINAILTPYTWLVAGAILGHCERLEAARKRAHGQMPLARPVLGDDKAPAPGSARSARAPAHRASGARTRPPDGPIIGAASTIRRNEGNC